MIVLKVSPDKTVTFTHFYPFDEKYGFGKTKEELLSEGYVFTDDLPQPEEIKNKLAVMKYDEVDGVYYEYVDRSPTQEEELAQIKALNAQLGQELVDFKLDYLSVPCQYHQEYSTWVDTKIEEDKANGSV